MTITDPEMEQRLRDLKQRRNDLQERLQSIRKDIAGGLNKDWEEQAIELENAEVLDEIARVSSEELRKVEQAIERLEKALQHD